MLNIINEYKHHNNIGKDHLDNNQKIIIIFYTKGSAIWIYFECIKCYRGVK